MDPEEAAVFLMRWFVEDGPRQLGWILSHLSRFRRGRVVAAWDDLVQEASLRFYRYSQTNTIRHPLAVMRTIVRNLVNDVLQSRPWGLLPDNLEEHLICDPICEEDTSARVMALLQRYPGADANAVQAVLEANGDYEQAARNQLAAEGVPQTTAEVAQRAHRLRVYYYRFIARIQEAERGEEASASITALLSIIRDPFWSQEIDPSTSPSLDIDVSVTPAGSPSSTNGAATPQGNRMRWLFKRILQASVGCLIVLLGFGFWRSYREIGQQDKEKVDLTTKLKDTEGKLSRVYEQFVTLPPTVLDEGRRRTLDAIVAENSISEDPEKRFVAGRAALLAGNALFESGKHGEAVTQLQQAVVIFAGLVESDRTNPAFRRQLAQTYNTFGNQKRRENKSEQAIEYYRNGLSEQRELIKQFPDVPDYLNDEARINHNLGTIWRDLKKEGNAIDAFKLAINTREGLINKGHKRHFFLHELGGSYGQLGLIQRSRKPPEYKAAKESYRQAIHWHEEAVNESPLNHAYQAGLGDAHAGLASTLTSLGRDHYNEAEKEFPEAIAHLQKAIDLSPNTLTHRSALSETLANFGALSAAQDNLPRARDLFEKAFQQAAVVVEYDNNYDIFRSACFDRYHQFLLILLLTKDYTRAEQLAAQVPWRSLVKSNDFLIVAGRMAQLMISPSADLPEEKRRQLIKGFNDRAMDLLRQAVQKGLRDPRPLGDKAFDPLRERQDFRQLLSELKQAIPQP